MRNKKATKSKKSLRAAANATRTPIMSTHTFKWSDPTPNEVYVTGTFDNWARSVKLDRTEDGFRKDVAVPIVGGKLLYKNANALFMRWGSPYDVIFNSPMISPVAS
ncbi:hypothetical protein RJZ56_002586 [Blastomyces dermatitidis]